jgi:class 3 adenylate cyclase
VRPLAIPPPPKNLNEPDERVEFPGFVEEFVEVAGFTICRVTQAPGWRWSTDAAHLVGKAWCDAHHVGVNLSGRQGALLRDGTVLEFGPGDVYDIPPGHDGYTIGDQEVVMIEWSGSRTFAGSRGGLPNRVLATLLFTDVVDSTSTVARLGDVAWRELLSLHLLAARGELERFGGREVATTGDGLLAVFDAPARAVLCAAAIRDAARGHGLQIRAGVHLGEVEQDGEDVRGIVVHEAARVMGAAEADEILVSDTTTVLAGAAGLVFEDRGMHELKGLAAPLHLFAYVG